MRNTVFCILVLGIGPYGNGFWHSDSLIEAVILLPGQRPK